MSNSSNYTETCSNLNHLRQISQNDSLCSLIMHNDDCEFDEGLFQYKMFVFCYAGGEIPALLLLSLWLIVLLMMLGITADGFFCPCLISMSKTLGLSHSLAGVTLVAFGNGAPDIFSAISSVRGMKDGNAGLAFGALLGSGLLMNCITGGSIMILKPFVCAGRPLIKDLTFYTIAVLWILSIMIKGYVNLWDTLGFIALYIIYATVTLTGRAIYSSREKKKIPPLKESFEQLEEIVMETTLNRMYADDFSSNNEQIQVTNYHDVPSPSGMAESITRSDNNNYQFQGLWKDFLYQIIPVELNEWETMSTASRVLEIIRSPLVFILRLTVPLVDDERPMKGWSKILYCLLCFTTPCVFIFIIKGGALAFIEIGNSNFPLYGLVLLISFVLSIIVWFTSKPDEPPVYHALFAFIGFAASIVWIFSVADEVVNILETIGFALNISYALLGLTLLAWANGLSDVIADLSVAKKNYPRIAYSACIGGSILEVFIGFGIPFTMRYFNDRKNVKIQANVVQYLLVGALLLVLLVKFTVIPFVLKFHVKKQLGFVLISIYAIFMAIVISWELIYHE